MKYERHEIFGFDCKAFYLDKNLFLNNGDFKIIVSYE